MTAPISRRSSSTTGAATMSFNAESVVVQNLCGTIGKYYLDTFAGTVDAGKQELTVHLRDGNIDVPMKLIRTSCQG